MLVMLPVYRLLAKGIRLDVIAWRQDAYGVLDFPNVAMVRGHSVRIAMSRKYLVFIAILFAAACTVEEPAKGLSEAQSETQGAPTEAPTAALNQAPVESPAGQTGLPEDAVRLAPNVIMDWTGFGQPMPAATIFTPHDWTAEGGIAWGQQFACTNGYAYNWRAVSPDGLSGIAILPQQKWEWSSSGQPLDANCPMAQFSTVPEYHSAVLQQMRPDAKIEGFRPRPDLEWDLAHLTGTTGNDFQQTQTQVQSGETFVSFTENGARVRGSLISSVLFTYMRTGGGDYSYTAPLENYTGFALPSYTAFAPEDQFDPAFFEGLRRSFSSDQRWEAAIAGHNQTMGRIASEGAMARSRITAQTYESIREMSQSAWESRQKSADHSAREFSEYLRDVETYDDPMSSTRQVELDSSYEHAWRMDDGTYILTNDHSFNPVEVYGQFGEELGASQ